MDTVIPPSLLNYLRGKYPWQCPLFLLGYEASRPRRRDVTRMEVQVFFNMYRCQNIGPHELNEKMENGEDFFLLDVRTPQENATQAIPGSYLIPLQDLRSRMNELPKNKEIVVYCRVGNRSAYACSHLSRLGYNVKNLEGGIFLWNMAGNASLATA